MIQLTAITARHKSLDDDFLSYADRAFKFHAQIGCDGVLGMKTGRFAHHLIEQQSDDAAMQEARASLVFLSEFKPTHNALAFIILLEREVHAPRIRPAATKASVFGFGIEPHPAPWTTFTTKMVAHQAPIVSLATHNTFITHDTQGGLDCGVFTESGKSIPVGTEGSEAMGNVSQQGALEGQNTESLAGNIIVVTGASRGIGRAIAMRLARDGATIVLVARDGAALAKVASEIEAAGGAATWFATDLRAPESAAALVEAAIATHGAIDALVNNAGATKRGDFFELSDGDWEDGFALKFFGAIRLTRAAWSHLKARKGSVLNIIGVGGRTPGAEFTIGGSVNGACLSFTKALADIGIRDGVQVNAINPGWIRTDRLRSRLESEAARDGVDINTATAEVVRKSNTVRLGEPEDVANLAAFLLSPQSRYLQGALIDLDGGQTKTI
jgi:NAD(P)-dependent dehydrogenase (short-subunit alcohol dehydrogenase family)